MAPGAPEHHQETSRRSRRRSSLTHRILTISCVGLLAGGLVAAGFGGLVLLRELERARSDLAAAAAGAAERVQGQLASVEQTLRALAAMPDITADPQSCAARLQAVNAPISALTSTIFLTDAAGIVRCALPAVLVGQDLSDGAAFQAVQAQDDPRLSSIVVGRFTPEELVGLSLALPTGGAGRGLIASGVRVRALSLPSRAAVASISLWLVDVEGRVVGLQADPGAVPPPPDILVRLRDGASIEEVTVGDVRLLATAEAIGPSLGIVATRPMQSVEVEALDLALWALLPALITLAVAVGLIALLLQRAVLLPLRLMAAGLDGATPVAASAIRHAVPTELDAIWLRVAQYQQQVREREDQLTDALDAQTHLTHEVHHRTKNNLQIVSSLLALQEHRSDDDDVVQHLRMARERVGTLATLHQQLYRGGSAERMDLGQFMRDLVASIGRANAVDTRGIRLRVECDDVEVTMDQGAPLGLVVNELVTNSLKYAFESRESGLVTVTGRLKGDELELVVADNGIGAPGEELPQGGLGSSLVRAFARQLHATIDRRAVPGTVIAITLPLARGTAEEATAAPQVSQAGAV